MMHISLEEVCVGREEIEEDSTEIGRQRERKQLWSRLGWIPVDRWTDLDRLGSRPMCMTCTSIAQSTVV